MPLNWVERADLTSPVCPRRLPHWPKKRLSFPFVHFLSILLVSSRSILGQSPLAVQQCLAIGQWGEWGLWQPCPQNPTRSDLDVQRRTRLCQPLPIGCNQSTSVPFYCPINNYHAPTHNDINYSTNNYHGPANHNDNYSTNNYHAPATHNDNYSTNNYHAPATHNDNYNTNNYHAPATHNDNYSTNNYHAPATHNDNYSTNNYHDLATHNDNYSTNNYHALATHNDNYSTNNYHGTATHNDNYSTNNYYAPATHNDNYSANNYHGPATHNDNYSINNYYGTATHNDINYSTNNYHAPAIHNDNYSTNNYHSPAAHNDNYSTNNYHGTNSSSNSYSLSLLNKERKYRQELSYSFNYFRVRVPRGTSACTDTCGGCGTQQRFRSCNHFVANCSCPGSAFEKLNCNMAVCVYPRQPTCCGSLTPATVNNQFQCA
ncbi:hypothetical protein GPALN_005427 [Globodera pallida]|nr:hypothetical protein GPALN_005427 [Globodera pallida]